MYLEETAVGAKLLLPHSGSTFSSGLYCICGIIGIGDDAVAKILTAVGAAVFLNGIFLCVSSNMNVGVILTVLLGLFFLAWGIFYKKIFCVTRKGVFKFIKNIILVLFSIELLFIGFIALYGQIDDVSYHEDAVIVLGAGIRGEQVTLPLKMRLDKAIAYNKKNPEAFIVVTGGRGFQETITEAAAMEQYLIKNGIEKERIIKEEKATSTNENMRFSKEILDSYFDTEYKIVVITNGFHIYRGVSIAKTEGFDMVSHLHAGLEWYNIIPCYLRESIAILKMWVFG